MGTYNLCFNGEVRKNSTFWLKKVLYQKLCIFYFFLKNRACFFFVYESVGTECQALFLEKLRKLLKLLFKLSRIRGNSKYTRIFVDAKYARI